MSKYVMIEATTGSQQTSGSLCKCHTFHTPRYPAQRGWQETFLSGTYKDNKYDEVVRKVGYPVSVPAVEGIKPDVGGTWVTQAYNVREGEVLKIFGQKRASFQGLMVSAALFICAREGAALNHVEIAVPTVTGSTRNFVGLRGRFDVLTMEEAIAKGVVILPNLEHQFRQINVNTVFQIEEMEPEASKRNVVKVAKIVETDAGQKRVILRKARNRKLDL